MNTSLIIISIILGTLFFVISMTGMIVSKYEATPLLRGQCSKNILGSTK